MQKFPPHCNLIKTFVKRTYTKLISSSLLSNFTTWNKPIVCPYTQTFDSV